MDALMEMLRALLALVPVLANPMGGTERMSFGTIDEDTAAYLEQVKPHFIKICSLLSGMFPGYPELVANLTAEMDLDVSQLDLEQTATFAEYCTMVYLLDNLIQEHGFTNEELAQKEPPDLPENATEAETGRHSAWYIANMFRMEMEMKLAELFGDSQEEQEPQNQE